MAFLNLPVSLILLGTASVALAQDDFAVPSSRDETTREERTVDLSAGVVAPYAPLTLSERYKWAARSSVQPARMFGYAVSSALSTGTNHPQEYGPHWDGMAKRFGIRAASGATGTMMEASIGALWAEDPRYVRSAGQPLKHRMLNVVKQTFLARNREGDFMPAYARYISVPANSFMSNAWRADSEANARHATLRIPMSFLSRAIGNAFTEFWPDASRLWHRE